MKNNQLLNSDATTADAAEFQGYSMEELRHTRALLAVRKEFARAKVTNRFSSWSSAKVESSDTKLTSKKAKRVASLAKKVFPKLNVLDYALVGLSIAGSAKKIYNLFGRKK
jgi:hypothetical protein